MATESATEPGTAEATRAEAPGVEAQERRFFACVMLLMIVPLYLLILLTLKKPIYFHLSLPVPAFNAIAVAASTIPALYSFLCALRLTPAARRGTGAGYALGAWICTAVGVAETAAVALAVYRFHAAV